MLQMITVELAAEPAVQHLQLREGQPRQVCGEAGGGLQIDLLGIMEVEGVPRLNRVGGTVAQQALFLSDRLSRVALLTGRGGGLRPISAPVAPEGQHCSDHSVPPVVRRTAGAAPVVSRRRRRRNQENGDTMGLPGRVTDVPSRPIDPEVVRTQSGGQEDG